MIDFMQFGFQKNIMFVRHALIILILKIEVILCNWIFKRAQFLAEPASKWFWKSNWFCAKLDSNNDDSSFLTKTCVRVILKTKLIFIVLFQKKHIYKVTSDWFYAIWFSKSTFVKGHIWLILKMRFHNDDFFVF